MEFFTYNDMVQDFDLEQLASTNQVTGYFDVPFTGRIILRRVIVHQDTGTPGCHDDRPKHLQRPSNAGIQIAQADQVVAYDPAARVENQNHQRFFALVVPVSLSDVLPSILHCTFWGVD